jgi:hypothetical protein
MCCFFPTQDAFACIRKEDEVFVWGAPTLSTAKRYLFKRKDVLVLLDPQEADQ